MWMVAEVDVWARFLLAKMKSIRQCLALTSSQVFGPFGDDEGGGERDLCSGGVLVDEVDEAFGFNFIGVVEREVFQALFGNKFSVVLGVSVEVTQNDDPLLFLDERLYFG